MKTLLGGRDAAQPESDYVANIEGWMNNMHATIRLDYPSPRTFEHRAAPREAVTLPILIVVEGTRQSALIRNLSSAGAMIVTSAPLRVRMKIEFQCGTICADGTVLWRKQDNFGIKFDQSICKKQLREQVLRSNAVVGWRKGYLQASAMEGSPNRPQAPPAAPSVTEHKDVAE